MATREHAPPQFLAQFPAPLWDALEYEDVVPESVVRGVQDGYAFQVVEMVHRGLSVFWGTARHETSNSTFFIVKLPQPVPAATLGWRPPCDASTDGHYVYLTRRKSVPVRHWRHMLQLAVEAAQSVRPDREAPAQRPHPGNIQDPRWIMLCVGVGGLLPLLFGGLFWTELATFMRHGQLHRCAGGAEFAQVMAGTRAWLYLGLLAVPHLGVASLVYSAVRRVGGGWFRLLLPLQSLLVLGAAFAAIGAAFSKIPWDDPPAVGPRTVCFIRG